MGTTTSRTFRSGNSEAVRLPKEMALGCDVEVTIVRSGDVLTIFPRKAPVGELITRLRSLPAPTSIEIRDEDLAPDRRGL